MVEVTENKTGDTLSLPKGLKQTEVGMIPVDWEVKSIGNHFEFKNGLNKEKKYFGSGTPIVNYMDVFENTAITRNVIHGKVQLSREEIKRYSVKVNDVFFTRTSETREEIGISAVCIEDLEDTVFSGFVLRARPKSSDFNSDFCRFCFSSSIAREQIERTASITTRALTNGRLLSDIHIPLPPTLTEQRAIATALSDMDDLIQAQEQLIAKKRAIKQGATQELLRPKEGWEVKKLHEILASTQLGGNYQNSKKASGPPLIKMGNIQRGYISLEKVEQIISQQLDERDKLRFHDLLFNTRNTLELVGKVAIWKNELPLAYFNSNLMRMVFKDEFISSNYFMNSLFNTEGVIKSLKDIATGTTSVAAIYTKDLLHLSISYPDKTEQTRIARILSNMDTEIEQLEAQLTKYRQLKVGMMQELLTGKKRLV
ncbi:restriction endonuclease subunit S [Cyclobacterium salsum]|uniref:restriction endonuclease subunit S n=1 Tax=Cyclobacterium salsum TaxID=2666329 RepID=UPI00139125FE|nr:restriction endonuclease subunit S [Cyclobacterium salsum]